METKLLSYKVNKFILDFEVIYETNIFCEKDHHQIYKKIITTINLGPKHIIDARFLKNKFKGKSQYINEYVALCMNYVRKYKLITDNKIIGDVKNAIFNSDNKLVLQYSLNTPNKKLEQMISKSKVILLPMYYFDELTYFIMIDISYF